jgi:hypothetical protein
MKIEIRPAKHDDFGKVHILMKEFAGFIGTPEKMKTTPTQMKRDAA